MTWNSDGIVAGYDGSPGADEALRWAVREARGRGGVLTVCLAWAPDHLSMLDDASVYDLAVLHHARCLVAIIHPSAESSGPMTSVNAEGSADRQNQEVSDHERELRLAGEFVH